MPQERDSAGNWSQEMQHDALVTGVTDDDEFTKFLDLENGLDTFQQIDDADGHTALDTPMGRLAFGQSNMQTLSRHDADIMQHLNMTMNGAHMSSYGDMQPNGQHEQFQPFQMYQQMNPNQHFQVPPTPVSAEMHAAKYVQQIENAGQLIFERNQASFTPLVSPAQTPLDNTWNMPDFVGVDDFFSPLTSPAMEAQPAFSTNATASPIDLNTDSNANQVSSTSVKRTRRKAQQPQQRSSVRSVRQSPAMKPQTRRRQFSISSVPLDRIETMLENSSSTHLQPSSARVATFASSEDSVSPEPLLEVLMRPPPVPSNAARSPTTALQGQSGDANMPATPAMLMRMPGKQTTKGEHVVSVNDDIMEDISLPAAAAVTPQQILPNTSTKKTAPEDDQSTPTMSATILKPSASNTSRSSTVNNSSETVDKIKRLDVKAGGRGSKKRQSISSAAMSPALRPKISPSISPLVPSTGSSHVSAETSALLLASRSNYQNILDGTHLPGVSYPENLAENLSSKRTSHKIAEQGRRNRINSALKEIESLLPPSITAGIKKEKSSTGSSRENDEGSPDKAGGGSGASKASTVEMAIIYIRSLQKELSVTREKLEAAEKAIAEGGSAGSQSSEAGTS